MQGTTCCMYHWIKWFKVVDFRVLLCVVLALGAEGLGVT